MPEFQKNSYFGQCHTYLKFSFIFLFPYTLLIIILYFSSGLVNLVLLPQVPVPLPPQDPVQADVGLVHPRPEEVIRVRGGHGPQQPDAGPLRHVQQPPVGLPRPGGPPAVRRARRRPHVRRPGGDGPATGVPTGGPPRRQLPAGEARPDPGRRPVSAGRRCPDLPHPGPGRHARGAAGRVGPRQPLLGARVMVKH